MAAKSAARKPGGRTASGKDAARRKPAALPFKVKKLPLPPPKEFDDGLTPAERVEPYLGLWTDEEADGVWKAILELDVEDR